MGVGFYPTPIYSHLVDFWGYPVCHWPSFGPSSSGLLSLILHHQLTPDFKVTMPRFRNPSARSFFELRRLFNSHHFLNDVCTSDAFDLTIVSVWMVQQSSIHLLTMSSSFWYFSVSFLILSGHSKPSAR